MNHCRAMHVFLAFIFSHWRWRWRRCYHFWGSAVSSKYLTQFITKQYVWLVSRIFIFFLGIFIQLFLRTRYTHSKQHRKPTTNSQTRPPEASEQWLISPGSIVRVVRNYMTYFLYYLALTLTKTSIP